MDLKGVRGHYPANPVKHKAGVNGGGCLYPLASFQAPATSAAQTTRARMNLNRKEGLPDLCRKTMMASNPPGQPPSALTSHREDSATRRRPVCRARHLSNPN